MFVRAVHLEENASTLDEAVEMYHAILELKPDHAPACINLGTIFYNQREFQQAEKMYRLATEADSDYALAFFDLGNVLDEIQRLQEAIDAYQRAIKLVPQYADAHYNLALAFERQGERRRALRHWMAYVRLDPVGPVGGACQGTGAEDPGAGAALDRQPGWPAGRGGGVKSWTRVFDLC